MEMLESREVETVVGLLWENGMRILVVLMILDDRMVYLYTFSDALGLVQPVNIVAPDSPTSTISPTAAPYTVIASYVLLLISPALAPVPHLDALNVSDDANISCGFMGKLIV